MEKSKLQSFINRYYLAGNCEAVKLNQNEEGVGCELIDMDQTIVGKIQWIVNQQEYYSIGLRGMDDNDTKILKLYRDKSITGPLSNKGYYKLEDIETKNHILCSETNLSSIGMFLIEIRFLLEMQTK